MYSDKNDIILKGLSYARDIDHRLCWITPEQVEFIGHHDKHTLTRQNGDWICDCSTFQKWVNAELPPLCQHVVALGRYEASAG
jgi:hypothetical protein